jgi:hypothetical protein
MRSVVRVVVVRAAATALACTAGVAGAVAAGDLAGPPSDLRPEPAGHEPSPAAARVSRLVHDHDCWGSDRVPRHPGQLPGHVVVTTAHGRAVWSAALVGAALDHVFENRHPALTVHAFCP